MLIPHYSVTMANLFYYRPRALFITGYWYSKLSLKQSTALYMGQLNYLVNAILDTKAYLESSYKYIFAKFTALMMLGCLVVISLLPDKTVSEKDEGLSVEQKTFGLVCVVWIMLHLYQMLFVFGRVIYVISRLISA